MKQKKKHIFLINLIINLGLLIFGHFILALAHFIGCITYMLSVKKFKRKNKKHPKFNIDYFRDKLKDVSPAYMSYLFNYQIELDKDVASHILMLYIDKYITIKDNKFVLTSKKTNKLKKSDKMLLEFVEKNFNDENFLVNYETCVKKEMTEDGYIYSKITKRDVIGLLSTFLIAFIIAFSLGCAGAYTNIKDYKLLYDICAIIALICALIFIFSPVVFFSKLIAFNKHGAIKRTQKGNELLEQIYGLKNFLKDFSIIDDREFKDVYPQEHYLVYALVLRVNTKVDDEILRKIKRQIRSRYIKMQ